MSKPLYGFVKNGGGRPKNVTLGQQQVSVLALIHKWLLSCKTCQLSPSYWEMGSTETGRRLTQSPMNKKEDVMLIIVILSLLGRTGGGGGSNVSSSRGPRAITIQRSSAGFGFTLRHFIVYPPDSVSVSQRERETSFGLCLRKKNKMATGVVITGQRSFKFLHDRTPLLLLLVCFSRKERRKMLSALFIYT